MMKILNVVSAFFKSFWDAVAMQWYGTHKAWGQHAREMYSKSLAGDKEGIDWVDSMEEIFNGSGFSLLNYIECYENMGFLTSWQFMFIIERAVQDIRKDSGGIQIDEEADVDI